MTSKDAALVAAEINRLSRTVSEAHNYNAAQLIAAHAKIQRLERQIRRMKKQFDTANKNYDALRGHHNQYCSCNGIF